MNRQIASLEFFAALGFGLTIPPSVLPRADQMIE